MLCVQGLAAMLALGDRRRPCSLLTLFPSPFPTSVAGLTCAGVEGEGAAPHPHGLLSQVPLHRQHPHPAAYLGCSSVCSAHK